MRVNHRCLLGDELKLWNTVYAGRVAVGVPPCSAACAANDAVQYIRDENSRECEKQNAELNARIEKRNRNIHLGKMASGMYGVADETLFLRLAACRQGFDMPTDDEIEWVAQGAALGAWWSRLTDEEKLDVDTGRRSTNQVAT